MKERILHIFFTNLSSLVLQKNVTRVTSRKHPLAEIISTAKERNLSYVAQASCRGDYPYGKRTYPDLSMAKYVHAITHKLSFTHIVMHTHTYKCLRIKI